jgi:hypothetical protein
MRNKNFIADLSQIFDSTKDFMDESMKMFTKFQIIAFLISFQQIESIDGFINVHAGAWR